MDPLNSTATLATTPQVSPDTRLWLRLGLLTLFAVYFYIFMEWLFFVTKPSFMDLMTLWQKADLLFTTTLPLFILSLIPLILLWGLSRLPWLSRISRWLFLAAGIVPALLLSVSTLLLLDNFTYTVFQFGIVSTHDFARLVYAVLFLVILVLWFRQVLRWLSVDPQLAANRRPDWLYRFGLALIVLPAILLVPKLLSFTKLEVGGVTGADIRRPNIIMIGGDGLNAGNTSVYGYYRDTTPNLRQLAKESLLAENTFPNASKTSGSIISMFNSKPPTRTRVVYPPDILRGSDAYQHLPGILHKLGYRTIEISVSHYIDAYTLNLRDGFDIVNNRTMDQAGFQLFSRFPAFQDFSYFLSVLVERLSDRILHIFFIQEMSNPYQEVTTTQTPSQDQIRVRRLYKYLDETDQPLFVHVHMIGTHGAKFNPNHYIFSKGKTQDSDWMTDFYDDAILDFDNNVGRIWSKLVKLGILEDTILIIYSDHGENYITDQRVPLIIRFPNGEYAGRIRSNVQNLDIAPTLLDYMSLPIPAWMEGRSLLAGEPDPERLIYSTGISKAAPDENGNWSLGDQRLKPPFYQFAYLQAVVCQNWYRLNLIDHRWEQGKISGHTAPCDPAKLPSPQVVKARMLERLQGDGFDTSSLDEIYGISDPD